MPLHGKINSQVQKQIFTWGLVSVGLKPCKPNNKNHEIGKT